jgi:hypothetical protein
MLAGGLDLFAELLQRFPHNIHVLLEIAKVRNAILCASWLEILKLFICFTNT